jgi:hypothetical protein
MNPRHSKTALACARGCAPIHGPWPFLRITRFCFILFSSIPFLFFFARKAPPFPIKQITSSALNTCLRPIECAMMARDVSHDAEDEGHRMMTVGDVFRTCEQGILRSLNLTWPSSVSRDSIMLGPHYCRASPRHIKVERRGGI